MKKIENIDQDEVTYDLRFVKLNERLNEAMLTALQRASYKAEYKKVKGREEFNLWFQIDADVDVGILAAIIAENGLQPEQYGLWISLTSHYDNGGVTLPDYVLKLYKQIGGSIDLSYIIIGDQDS